MTLTGIYGEACRSKLMEYRIQHCQVIVESTTVEENIVYIRIHVLLVSQHYLQSPYKSQNGVLVPIWNSSELVKLVFEIESCPLSLHRSKVVISLEP